MSSKKFEPPLHIELVPSKRMLVFLLTVHLGAVSLTYFFETSWLVKVVFTVLLLVSMLASLCKSGWIEKLPMLSERWPLLRWQYYPQLIWGSDNDWQILTRNGQGVLAELLPSSTCHESLVALNFRTDRDLWLDRYLSVVILADAVDREVFRRLRVRLRTRFVQVQDN